MKVNQPHSGFTLVELLLALVLSAMLLTAVLGVVGRLSRNTDLITWETSGSWKRAAVMRLEQEMMNGTSYLLSENSLTIYGFSEQAHPSQINTLRKNVIHYFIRELEGVSYLVRQASGPNGTIANLVCDGVTSMEVVGTDGRAFNSRAGGFDQNISFCFLDTSGDEVFIVSHMR